MEQTRLCVLLDVHVDRKMCVDVAHLVFKALCDADYQVIDDRPHRAEGGNVLATSVVNLNANDTLLRGGEVDRDMAEVLRELAPRALDRDLSRLDGDLD